MRRPHRFGRGDMGPARKLEAKCSAGTSPAGPQDQGHTRTPGWRHFIQTSRLWMLTPRQSISPARISETHRERLSARTAGQLARWFGTFTTEETEIQNSQAGMKWGRGL